MTNEQLTANLRDLAKRVSKLEDLLNQLNRNEADAWRSEGEEEPAAPVDEQASLPTVHTTIEPPPTRKQEIETRAAYFLTDAGSEYRKQVEAYLNSRDDPTRRRSMLHLLLELAHKEDPSLTADEAQQDFERPLDEIEEMLQLDLDADAVKLLRSQGK